MHYQNIVVKLQEMTRYAYIHEVFCGCAKHWGASTDVVEPLKGFNRMAWIQSIFQMLALSCGLLDIWLQLGVHLGVLLLTGCPLLSPTPPSFPTCLTHVSTTPYKIKQWWLGLSSLLQVASSRKAYHRWLGLSTWSYKHAWFPVQALMLLLLTIAEFQWRQNHH